MISIVIPVLNEASVLSSLLQQLAPLQALGHEVIVVDGGSNDHSCEVARSMADHLRETRPGRAQQMNIGAGQASGDVLWFLHVDSVLPPRSDELILAALSVQHHWGWFDVRLSGFRSAFRIIERCMNQRARWSRIATGDQGLFVTRHLYKQSGGFPDIPLMEDIVLSRRLKRLNRPVVISNHLTTSSRRWESQGIVRTVLRMWLLRAAFASGVSPQTLALYY